MHGRRADGPRLVRPADTTPQLCDPPCPGSPRDRSRIAPSRLRLRPERLRASGVPLRKRGSISEVFSYVSPFSILAAHAIAKPMTLYSHSECLREASSHLPTSLRQR